MPENKKTQIEQVISVGNNYLVVHYIEDVKSVMKFYNLSDGNFLFERRIKKGATITLPGILLTGISKENEFFFMEKSFLEPGTIYHHDFDKNQTRVMNV